MEYIKRLLSFLGVRRSIPNPTTLKPQDRFYRHIDLCKPLAPKELGYRERLSHTMMMTTKNFEEFELLCLFLEERMGDLELVYYRGGALDKVQVATNLDKWSVDALGRGVKTTEIGKKTMMYVDQIAHHMRRAKEVDAALHFHYEKTLVVFFEEVNQILRVVYGVK